MIIEKQGRTDCLKVFNWYLQVRSQSQCHIIVCNVNNIFLKGRKKWFRMQHVVLISCVEECTLPGRAFMNNLLKKYFEKDKRSMTTLNFEFSFVNFGNC